MSLCLQRLYMFLALNRRFYDSPHSRFSVYFDGMLCANVQLLYVLSLVDLLCENHASNAHIALVDFTFFSAIFSRKCCRF